MVDCIAKHLKRQFMVYEQFFQGTGRFSFSKTDFPDKRIETISMNVTFKSKAILHKWIKILSEISNMESRRAQAPENSAAGLSNLTQGLTKSLAGDDNKDSFDFRKRRC